MKKTMRRLFAILMTLAIAITAIPMTEVKAAESDVTVTFSFDKDNMLLTDETWREQCINVTASVSGTTKEISHINIGYECEEEEIYSTLCYEDGQLTSTIWPEDTTISSGVYEILVVDIRYTDDDFEFISLENVYGDRSFSIDNQIDDKIAPVISEVTLSPVGEELNVGDTVTITAKITDENLDDESIGMLLYGPDERYEYIYLKNKINDIYQAELVLDDSYAGLEWFLQAVTAMDTIGNYGEYNPLYEGIYLNFYVLDSNEEYENVTYKDVSFIFTDEQGDYTEDDIVMKEEVPVVISVEDILGEESEPTNDKYGDFLGWSVMGSEKLYETDEKFAISYDEQEVLITPVFEYESIWVIKLYVGANGELIEEESELLIPTQQKTTYQDVIEKVSPPTSLEGLTFLGWTLEEGIDASQELWGSHVLLNAKYEEKVIYVDCLVYTEDGSRWTGYKPYIVEEDITYAELLELYPAANDILGCKFLNWEYDEDAEIDLDEVILDMEWVDLFAVYDKEIINVYRNFLDENGDVDYDYEFYALEDGATYAELLALLPKPETVKGCQFVNWKIDGDIELTDEVDFTYGIDVYAEYDNYPVIIEKTYVDEAGEVKTEEINDIYPAGTKMEDIIENYTDIPADANNESFEWIKEYEEGEVDLWNNYIFLTADYEDSMIVNFVINYIQQAEGYGLDIYDSLSYLVDKTNCADEMGCIEYFEEHILPTIEIEHFDGYDFEEWYFEAYENEKGYYHTVVAQAEYDMSNAITVQMTLGEKEDSEFRYYVVNPRDVITLPTEFAGYYLTWEGYDFQQMNEATIVDNKFVVPEDAQAGYGYWMIAENGEKVKEQDTPPVDTPPADNPPADEPKPNVPPTGDATSVLPYMLLLLFGAGVYMVGNKRRNFVR